MEDRVGEHEVREPDQQQERGLLAADPGGGRGQQDRDDQRLYVRADEPRFGTRRRHHAVIPAHESRRLLHNVSPKQDRREEKDRGRTRRERLKRLGQGVFHVRFIITTGPSRRYRYRCASRNPALTDGVITPGVGDRDDPLPYSPQSVKSRCGLSMDYMPPNDPGNSTQSYRRTFKNSSFLYRRKLESYFRNRDLV